MRDAGPRSPLRALAGPGRWALLPVAFGLWLPLCGAWLEKPGLRDADAQLRTRIAWALDLAVHWQCLLVVAWCALCLLCALRGRRWLWLMPFALLPLWTASPSLPAARGEGATFVVASANVNLQNRDPASLVAWLRAQPADAVAILELTPAYATALTAALGDDYPHRAFFPDRGAFGIGLISRHPLRTVERIDSPDGIPQLRARIDDGHGPVRIVAVHPVPPMDAHWRGERDRLLFALAEEATRTRQPMIVLGDLNATPWSTALTGAARRGLFRATGLAPTWPGRHVGIPIDHVLASAHWRRGESTRGPAIGSDHLPVWAVLERTPRDRMPPAKNSGP